MCFLHGSDSMLLLDKQFNLIEYRYLSGTMKLVHKRINEDTHIKKFHYNLLMVYSIHMSQHHQMVNVFYYNVQNLLISMI